jgi:hypothetical protein
MTLRTVEQRMKEHRRTQFSGCRYLVNAINKHGFDNFTKEVLWEGEDTQTPEMERLMISKYDTLAPNGYNLKTGGEQRGERYSKDQIDYMSYRQREAHKLKNDGLLGYVQKTTTNGKNDGPTRYRLKFAGKNFGTFQTLEECIKVQTDLTNNPDVYLEKYASTLPPPVCVFEDTQRLGRTVWKISYKNIYLGTWTNREIADKVRHYILEHDKKWEREELINTLKVDGLTEYLPEIPNYKYVKFRKLTGNWYIQFKLNGKYVKFGEWRSEERAYYARDCIKDNNITSRNELISYLKSEELDEYLPIIRQVGSVFLVKKDKTWAIKIEIDGKAEYFGRRKTEREARELLDYILDMGFKSKKELESSLPKKQTGSSVYLIKSDGTWGIKVPINGKRISFGQCKSSDIGWKLVEYIRDNSIKTKQELLDSLKSNSLVEYLDEYLPKIRRVGRVRKMGNTYQAILRGKFLGSFKTKQEAEDAIRHADQHQPCSTSSP